MNNLDTNARLVAKTMDTVCAFIDETKLPYKLAFKVRRESKYFLQVRPVALRGVSVGVSVGCACVREYCWMVRRCIESGLQLLFCFRHSAQNRSEAHSTICNSVQPAVGETRLAHRLCCRLSECCHHMRPHVLHAHLRACAAAFEQ